MRYNWQQKDWPRFRFDLTAVEPQLLVYLQKTAQLNGMLLALPESLRSEAVVDMMTTGKI
jgi:Fic family protein